jgi:predicted nuclease of predicted toxin-antitoxin system
MPRTIKFHLDENIDPRVGSGLRRRGIDLTTAAEVGLLHATDEEHFAHAEAEHRTIITHDADFLRLDAAGLHQYGIAYSRPENLSLGELIRRVALIWEVYSSGNRGARRVSLRSESVPTSWESSRWLGGCTSAIAGTTRTRNLTATDASSLTILVSSGAVRTGHPSYSVSRKATKSSPIKQIGMRLWVSPRSGRRQRRMGIFI